MGSTLGGVLDSALPKHSVFPENGLVMLDGLNYLEGATLPCAALTAWNALYGLKPLKPGEYILTQGTGSVALFAL
jgi:NADPH:quinone reductase-like Zn-dependent oxidoreductase